MSEMVSWKCENCGAGLPALAPGEETRCHYCGHAVRAPAPPPPEPIRIEIRGPSESSRPARRGRPRAGCGCAGTIAGLAIAAGAALFAMRAGHVTITPGAGDGGHPLFGNLTVERLLWDDVGGMPLPATIGGSEAVVGRIRAGTDDSLFVVAVDPTTRRERWRAGPFGTYSDGYRATFYTVAGANAVITDFHSVVHVLDAATGKEQRAAHLTDRAEQLCPLPDTKQVFVHQVDKKDVTVDLATGAVKETKRPAQCPELLFGDPRRRRDDAKPTAPRIPNFDTKRVLVDGDVAIAAGVKSPGTEIPMAAGFDPKSKAVLWQQVVPAVDPATVRASEAFFLGNKADALGAGRYASVYGTGSDRYRLTALDAKTGGRLWDVELKKILGVDRPNDVVLTPTYCYVTRSTSLEVFDAKTGKLLGVYGSE